VLAAWEDFRPLRVDDPTRLLTGVLDALPLSLYVVDRRLRVVAWNRYRETGPLGRPRSEVLGRPLEDVLSPQGFAAVLPSLERVFDTGVALEETTETRQWERTFRVWRLPVLIGSEVTHVVSLFEDVTERRLLEEQFRQAQTMEAMERLAGAIAQDVNNALTAIAGHAELLMLGLDREDGRRGHAQEILGEVRRAAGVPEQLLAFSGRQVLRPAPTDLNAVLEDLAAMLRRVLGEEIGLEVVTAPRLGPVSVDRGKIEQVLLNLAVNARDAMPGRGRLTIETANVHLSEADVRFRPGLPAGPYVMVSVTDTGVGMDAETQAHLFEPFFTTRDGDRSGLGLATVHGIVGQSGGCVAVSSAPGRGTTFRIYLPRVSDAERGVLPIDASLAGGTETILLAEDQEAVRTLARKVLEKWGYRVLEAAHGLEALDMARRHEGPIHLLLTDLSMPYMGGDDLARHLFRSRPEMRTLVVSARSDDTRLLDALAVPGADFMSKPFTLGSLARKVRQVLDQPRDVSQAPA
jgi:signal transduction histidine kinase/ActR/RegA family two-component response regulator